MIFIKDMAKLITYELYESWIKIVALTHVLLVPVLLFSMNRKQSNLKNNLNSIEKKTLKINLIF